MSIHVRNWETKKGEVKTAFVLDYYEPNGTRRREFFDKLSDAKKAQAIIRADILRNEYRLKGEKKLRFEEFAREFGERRTKGKRRACRRDPLKPARLKEDSRLDHLTDYFRGMYLSKITRRQVEDYRSTRLEAQTYRKRTIKPRSINREIALLRRMFNEAVEYGYLDNNPASRIKMFDEPKKELVIPSNDELDNLIRAAAPHLRPIIILAVQTGMRQGEILNLRWRDVDLEKRSIYLSKTKSGKPRRVPLTDFVVDILGRLKSASEHIFLNPDTGRPIQCLRTGYTAACRRAGFKDFTFHDLRHCTVSYLLGRGVDPVTVSQIVGHGNLGMTALYSHALTPNMERAVETLSACFGKVDVKVDTWRTHKTKSAPEVLLESIN